LVYPQVEAGEVDVAAVRENAVGDEEATKVLHGVCARESVECVVVEFELSVTDACQ
jgi:hypothetical protein